MIFSSCSSYNYNKPFGIKSFEVHYNHHLNTVIENKIYIRNLGDIRMFLHEYGHYLYFNHTKPNKKLIVLLEKEYDIPPDIIPTYKNRELQDFITTSTRWKIKYPFRHKEDCFIVEELMANLFVIFTLGGEELDFIKQNYSEIHQEYKKYYDFITGQKVVTNE
ncbi:MAG: hypothetical protein ACRCW9_03025 [Cetobacterium sp.]